MNYSTSEFFDAAGSWPAECVHQLETSGSIATPIGEQFGYASLPLSGKGLVDDYDPDHLSTPSQITSMIVPGTYDSSGMKIEQFATMQYCSEPNDTIVPANEVRAKLLDLSIGSAALGRYNADPNSQIGQTIIRMAQSTGMPPRDLAEQFYGLSNVPLAVVSFRKLIEHKTAAPDSPMAALYVPVGIHPRLGLRWLQATVKELDAKDDAMWQVLKTPPTTDR